MSKEHNLEHPPANGQRAPEECPSFETLSLLFDKELDGAETERVGAHVADCAACQAVLADLALIQQALRASTPAASNRSFRLTAEDVRDEGSALQPETPGESEPARRVTRLTIPFLPALTAVAALLLIAIVIGDVISDDSGSDATPTVEAADVIVIDGTSFPVTDEDREGVVGSASDEPMNPGNDNERFWDWWRIGEILLLATLAGLLATIFLQNRSRRESRRNQR